MANTIQHKRSSTATTVPTAGQLSAGELAVNTADGKLYLKKDDASIVQIGGPAAAGDLTGATLASGVTASSLTSVGTLASLTVTATIVGSVNGNAATATTATNVTTNANLTGHITSTGNATVLGTAAFSSANLAGALTDETGSGAAVFATSPTLVTPALGTPSALVGTNISGTGASFTAGNVTTNANLTGHITSTGNATVLGTAAFSSANLAGALTDETGSGAAVFATSPTLVTPALGTPSALVGTNISGTGASFTAGNVTTNANLTGHITSTGNATVLGTAAFSSANLAGALTDETGTGSAVFATSPTLVTPALGTPSALVGTNISGTGASFTAGNVTTNANLTGHITSTGNATVLGTAAFSSANLAGALTDETGSGAAVFATSPTLVTPALGTPSALVGTNISGTGASFTAGTATNATNVAITSDNTGTSYFVPFVTAATGNNGLKADAGTGANGLTYIPSTATLTTGNVIASQATLQILTSAGDLSITTASGSTNDVTIAPYGIITLSPTSSVGVDGSTPSIVVSNTDGGFGLVTVAGGDLYLSRKTEDEIAFTQVNIIFEGATADGFETTLTVTDPTADRTITLPNATGTVALTTDLSQFAATSSAQLATLISDETGSGALVFATSPTLVTPALGTPSALVGTNISGTGAGFTAGNVTTNANLTGHITSTGNATVLGTAAFSSANLAGALTDETGSGAAVFATSPTLVTPTLGAATATSLTTGNTGVKVGEHVTRFLNITSDGANSAITQGGNTAGTLTISHTSFGDIYIGDSAVAQNGTHINVNDNNSTIILDAGSVSVVGGLTLDANALISATSATALAIKSAVPAGTGVTPTVQIICPSAATALTDGSSAQNVFSPVGYDTISAQASTTYMFDGQYIIKTTGTTTHTISMSFALSGGASVTNCSWTTLCHAQVAPPTTQARAQDTNFFAAVAGGVITATNSTAFNIVKFQGMLRMNAAGNVVPQLTFSAAPGGTNTLEIGSYLKFYPIGSNTINSVGTAIG